MGTDGVEQYTIGQMANICNVTKKQLRYYDKNGILVPFYKNDETGYRYYSENQIREVMLIKELKKTDLSLRDISDILNSEDVFLKLEKLGEGIRTAKQQLQIALNRYNQTVDAYHQAAEAIKNLEKKDANRNEAYEIEIVDVPLRRIVSSRHASYWNAKKLFISRRAELYQLVDQYGLQTSGTVKAIFHGQYMNQFSDVPEDSEGDLEVAIAVKNGRNCSKTRTMGGFQALTTIHVGSYLSLKKAYEKLQMWADAKGYELEDCSIEEYICGSTMTHDENQYVTRIYIPILEEKR